MSNLKKIQDIESKYHAQTTRLFGTTENRHLQDVVAYMKRGVVIVDD